MRMFIMRVPSASSTTWHSLTAGRMTPHGLRQVNRVNREMGWPMEKVNVNGGAIAIGHPIGASGARILISLLFEMMKRDSRYGLATLCVGGGMGAALILERK